MTADVFKKAKLLLIESEGFSSSVYRCTRGFKTIGYGRNISANPLTSREKKECYIDGKGALSISRETASEWLDREIMQIYGKAKDFKWFDKLSENRQAVVIDMIYNLGFSGFLKFKNMLDFIDKGDFESAGDEMEESQWAKQVGLRSTRNALIMRRDKLLNYTDADIFKNFA